MKSGIYSIRNKINRKIYIGQSVDVKRRLQYHKTHLTKGTHKNTYLQRSFTEHGEDNFEFKIIEYCPVSELDKKEIYWIDKYKSNSRENGYNIQSGGHDGHTWNEEAKERRSGSGNPMFGKKHSEEFVEHIRKINRASSDKLTVEDVEDIKRKLANGKRQKEISKEYGVDISTINKISRCENWEWVKPELNYEIMNIEKNKKDIRNRKIQEMYSDGMTAQDIAKELHCNPSTIANVAEELIQKRKNDRKELIENVVKDFKNGKTRKEIMEKYKISNTSYTRYVTEAYNEEKKKKIEKVIEMRKSGMLVKDIAKELNLHRTTVTEYCKKYGSW